jgi:hypothetical protein
LKEANLHEGIAAQAAVSPLFLVTAASSHGMVPSNCCDAGDPVWAGRHFALSLLALAVEDN